MPFSQSLYCWGDCSLCRFCQPTTKCASAFAVAGVTSVWAAATPAPARHPIKTKPRILIPGKAQTSRRVAQEQGAGGRTAGGRGQEGRKAGRQEAGSLCPLLP